MKRWDIFLIVFSFFFTTILFSCNPSAKKDKSIHTLKEYREMRQEKLSQPRPLIHNNDGCDTYLYPSEREFSIPNFLDYRSAGLVGSDVSTISYCTISSSFGQFTHNTKVGEFLTIQHNRPGRKNVVPEFVKLGTDPLEVTSEFAHGNGFEFFWSNRINDTHDSGHRPDKPYERWSELKQAHPEYLMGTVGEKLPHARWSAVDFSYQEIRDLCVQYYTEVCENYDVDGIELDFFRHLYLFGSVARGEIASLEQLEMMTDMLAKIREMNETVGMKKGKPILVLVRVPDSKEYCRGIGIDIENWMAKGLVDIVAGSGYFRLNYWKDLASLGENNNVKMYAGLSESRVKGEHPFLVRQQNAVFRARASAAWEAGIDGLYIFNEYDTRAKYLSEIGSPDKLKNTNNLYFVTYRDYTAGSYLNGGDNFSKMPRLSPTSQNTWHSFAAAPLVFDIELGEELAMADVFAAIYAENVQPGELTVKINGGIGQFHKTDGNGLYIFKINQSATKPGVNQLSVGYRGKVKDGQVLKDAAMFFCRDKNDLEMKGLVAMCQ